MDNTLTFKTALILPFRKPLRLLYILWFFVPVYGWFLLMGYVIKVTKMFLRGEFVELPEIDLGYDFVFGLKMFFKAVPFALMFVLVFLLLPILMMRLAFGLNNLFFLILVMLILILIALFVYIFLLPVLFLNFFNKETIESLFEFKVISYAFSNIAEYLKAFGYKILFNVFFISTLFLLVGIINILKFININLYFVGEFIVVLYLYLVVYPVLSFVKNIFIANFYRRFILPVMSKEETKKDEHQNLYNKI